jgi:general secretion pathway protein G
MALIKHAALALGTRIKNAFNQAGVTLIELLAVIVILGILAGVGFTVVTNSSENARISTDDTNINLLVDATQRFLMDRPNTGSQTWDEATELTANLVNNGYIGAVPTDPWGGTGAYQVSITAPSGGNAGTITVTSPHTRNSTGTAAGKSINYR